MNDVAGLSETREVQLSDPVERLDIGNIDGRIYSGLRILSGGNEALVAPTYLPDAACRIEAAGVYGLQPPSIRLESLAPLALFPVTAITLPLRYMVAALRNASDIRGFIIESMHHALVSRQAYLAPGNSEVDWNRKEFSESIARRIIEDTPSLAGAISFEFKNHVVADMVLAVIRESAFPAEHRHRDMRALVDGLESAASTASTEAAMNGRSQTSDALHEVLDLLTRFRRLWN